MTIAFGRSKLSSVVEIKCLVSGSKGQCKERTSIWGRSSAKVEALVWGMATPGAFGQEGVHLVFAEVGE
jgi:hypothetical protein